MSYRFQKSLRSSQFYIDITDLILQFQVESTEGNYEYTNLSRSLEQKDTEVKTLKLELESLKGKLTKFDELQSQLQKVQLELKNSKSDILASDKELSLKDKEAAECRKELEELKVHYKQDKERLISKLEEKISENEKLKEQNHAILTKWKAQEEMISSVAEHITNQLGRFTAFLCLINSI